MEEVGMKLTEIIGRVFNQRMQTVEKKFFDEEDSYKSYPKDKVLIELSSYTISRKKEITIKGHLKVIEGYPNWRAIFQLNGNNWEVIYLSRVYIKDEQRRNYLKECIIKFLNAFEISIPEFKIKQL